MEFYPFSGKGPEYIFDPSLADVSIRYYTHTLRDPQGQYDVHVRWESYCAVDAEPHALTISFEPLLRFIGAV